MSAPLLSVTGATKRFGGAVALRGVDFALEAGQIHALLGENGAGKSTLMGLLSGVHAPDAGEIRIDGTPVRFASPRDAQAAGIATVFQELDLVPGLDVAANLFLGHEIMRPGGRLDTGAMRREAAARLAPLDPSIEPSRRIADLSIGQRQVVAIAKALSYASRILIMDEPTAALTVGEVERLFGLMRRLKQAGTGIVYISHRLEEVPQIADRVTVMRDGAVAGTALPGAPQAELVRLLVGRDLDELYPPRSPCNGPVLLRLRDARFRLARAERHASAGWQAPARISLEVREGEIVGLAGLMGAGRTELLSALFGTGRAGRWEGEVTMGGQPARLGSVAAARRAGLGFVTDDRRGGGLMLRMAVGLNLVMSVIPRISPRYLLSRRLQGEAVQDSFARFGIRPREPSILAGALSGGNQQKIVLAKETLAGPRLLLLDEPTRGVDVGAKAEIYARLRELAGKGLGILVASSEMPELTGLCDRIIVLRQGQSVAEFAGAGATEHALLAAANGGEG